MSQQETELHAAMKSSAGGPTLSPLELMEIQQWQTLGFVASQVNLLYRHRNDTAMMDVSQSIMDTAADCVAAAIESVHERQKILPPLPKHIADLKPLVFPDEGSGP